jgi:hypothetical protein
MYAEDIILLSKSAKGLQKKLDILNTYCKDWCLTVNTSKTKILIFNNVGRLLKHSFLGMEMKILNVYQIVNI